MTWPARADVVDLQPFATRAQQELATGVEVELVNLNPYVSAQYLLRVGKNVLHLQFPPYSRVELAPLGVQYEIPGQLVQTCELYSEKGRIVSIPAKASYTSVCGEGVYVRKRLNPHTPGMAAHAEMLRSWGSWTESVINAYKGAREQLGLVGDEAEDQRQDDGASAKGALSPALLAPEHERTTLAARHLRIALSGVENKRLAAGRWFSASNFDNTYVSVITPAHIHPSLFETHKDRVNSLYANNGGAQRQSLVYLVAMDLGNYELGWVHGADHPGVAWSRRHKLPRDNPRGPDGFNKLAPFVPTGTVSPVDLRATMATFSGGFQRRHGAFRYGELAKTRKAHHYGFMEDGVVLSSLTPGLATIVGYRDGRTELKTWLDADSARLKEQRYARQNGVPLIEGGGADTVGIPGRFVGKWGAGNWSGSAERELRTPRAAACLIDENGVRLLVYAYFSGHTPSGMARVLQAYRCDYAVHLDMNSAGQAYFALFRKTGEGPFDYQTEHLVKSMSSVDAWFKRRATPRFLLKGDYKDFFYVKRRR